MFIVIKDNYDIQSFDINKDFEYHGIHIYLKDKDYFISLSEGLYFQDDTKTKKVYLKEYEIKQSTNYISIFLYVYQNNQGFNDYKLYERRNLIISNNRDSDIVCKDKYLKDYYLEISSNYLKSDFKISYNHKQYNGEELTDNDEIEFLGIRIIYNHKFLYINNFMVENKLKLLKIEPKIIKYQNTPYKDQYYVPKEINELIIEDIKPFVSPTKNKHNNIIKNLLTSLLMSASMSIMAINSYLNAKDSLLAKIGAISMPICMFISSIILPTIYYFIEKHKDKKVYQKAKTLYIEYLDEYLKSANKKIDDFIKECNSHYFSLLNAKDKTFYASKNTSDFLTLSLGLAALSKDVKYEETIDAEINDKLKAIKNRLMNIEDYPVFVDLKKSKIVTFKTKKSLKMYYFNKVLLELAYKHHYLDINIAIYAKDMSVINNIYNLPHLFKNNKRLTFNSEKQLQILDQERLDCPLILLAFDNFTYQFSNPNISIVYFTSEDRDIYKNSEVLVEYSNSNYLIDRKVMPFKYLQEIINFNDYFKYLSNLKQFNNQNEIKMSSLFNELIIDNNYSIKHHGLRADFALCDNDILAFDLSENKQGPHGLIGGSTGSGKSELIVSLLLSLTLRYPPDYLNIILIDYKGGGLNESLSYNNVSIPHIIASLSNLENNSFERLIIAIHNECLKRQKLFKQLSTKINISIMNLDDYLNNNVDLENMAHLLIVVDEFAELKKNNPEQIKELISLSRIGRSLGIHLILATQKPAGVIDDEIWSNSHFKISLKVFEESDSQDLIKDKRAAYLNNPGEFYLKVDDGLLEAKAIYCKHDINDNDPYSVSILDNTLQKIETKTKFKEKTISECTYFAKKIIEISNKKGIKANKLNYMPPIEIRRQTNKLIIGTKDDYFNCVNNSIELENTNIYVCSSRKNEINSFLNYLCEANRKTIVISKNKYANKVISDCINYDDKDNLEYLFNCLLNNQNNNLTMVIEDGDCLLSYDDSYLNVLMKILKRSNINGINVIMICTTSQISYKLINSFSEKLLIKSLDNNDIGNIYSCRSRYIGDSYIYDEEPITMVPCLVEDFKESKQVLSSIIKVIPDKINPTINDKGCLLGYDLTNKEAIYYNESLLISSYSKELIVPYQKYGSRFTYKEYQKNNLNNDYNNILWLGSGVFEQRLFYINTKNDLNDDEGILFVKGKKRKIRILNE